MNFRPELAQKVMTGEKTVTRRLASDNPRSPWFRGSCRLLPRHTYAVCPGRGKNAIGRVAIVRTELMRLGHLSDAEARREGFADGASFEAAFTGINGSYDAAAEVWRIEFKLAASPVDGGGA
ncbi:MAG: hypothetical protein JWQ48_2411 [Conexibacter sp.]|nr:hypothetical protein [Conexibacter sp.]